MKSWLAMFSERSTTVPGQAVPHHRQEVLVVNQLREPVLGGVIQVHEQLSQEVSMEQSHAIHCLSAASGGPPRRHEIAHTSSCAQERNCTHAGFKLCGVINGLSSKTKISDIIPEGYLHLYMRMVTDKRKQQGLSEKVKSFMVTSVETSK